MFNMIAVKVSAKCSLISGEMETIVLFYIRKRIVKLYLEPVNVLVFFLFYSTSV